MHDAASRAPMNSYELGEYLYTETTIRAPVRTVWPVFLDMNRWYTSDPKSMSAEYGTEVRDLVAFYHWHFTEVHRTTTIAVRSYSNIRTDKRPSEAIVTDLMALFHRSWNKCLKNLEELVREP
jgi:hypothetical protein